MIKGTVALPVYNSFCIAWLCMESLCRQVKPIDGWELIVYEEMHLTQLGESYFRSYEDRLRDCGCERIIYLTAQHKIPLSQKWVEIARNASPTSVYYCMCAADNYYQPWMLCDAEIQMEIAEWAIMIRGYFYDILLRKIIMYHYQSLTGLQMIARTEMVRQMPIECVNRGVDGWFYDNLRRLKGGDDKLSVFIDASDRYQQMLCTNGLNNISTGRVNYFYNTIPPFYKTDKRLEDIIPDDIVERLNALSYRAMADWVDDDTGITSWQR